MNQKEAKSKVSEWLKKNAPTVSNHSATAVVAYGDVVFLFTPDKDGSQGYMNIYNKSGAHIDKQYIHNSLSSGVASGKTKDSIETNYIDPWKTEVSSGRRPVHYDPLPQSWRPPNAPSALPQEEELAKTTEATKTLADAVRERIETEEAKAITNKKIIDYLTTQQRLYGIDPQETLKSWKEDSSLIPEELGIAEIPDDIFTKSWNYLSQQSDPKEDIKGGQEKRTTIFEELKDKLLDQEETQIAQRDYLVDPERGDPNLSGLWGTLTEDERGKMTLPALIELGRQKEVGAYKEQAQGIGSVWGNAFTDHQGALLPENLNIHQPKIEDAEKAFEERYPNWKPKSSAGFRNQREYLQNRGVHPASSGFLALDEEEQKAAQEERQREVDAIYDRMLKQHAAGGDTIDFATKLGDNSLKYQGAGTTFEQSTMDPLRANHHNQQHQNNLFAGDIAEGELKNSQLEDQGNMLLREILAKEQLEDIEKERILSKDLMNFFDLKAQIDAGKIQADQNFLDMQHRLWMDHKKIEAMFKELGYKEQALELENAARNNDITKWAGILSTFASIGSGLLNAHLDRKATAKQNDLNRAAYQGAGNSTGGGGSFIGGNSQGSFQPYIAPPANGQGIVVGGKFTY